jgi:proteasome alpha subunit
VTALGSTGDNPPRELLPTQLEVAVLDRSAVGRTFRRIPAALLATLLAPPAAADVADAPAAEADPAEPDQG